MTVGYVKKNVSSDKSTVNNHQLCSSAHLYRALRPLLARCFDFLCCITFCLLIAHCWSSASCSDWSLAFRQRVGLQSYCRPTYHCGVVKKQSHMYASGCMEYCIVSPCKDLDSYHSSSCFTAGKRWGHFSSGKPCICVLYRVLCSEWFRKHLSRTKP